MWALRRAGSGCCFGCLIGMALAILLLALIVVVL
jgi:hypothetical protein